MESFIFSLPVLSRHQCLRVHKMQGAQNEGNERRLNVMPGFPIHGTHRFQITAERARLMARMRQEISRANDKWAFEGVVECLSHSKNDFDTSFSLI